MVAIYADCADLASIATLARDQSLWLAGLTTNPTLLKKSGISDYAKFARTVLKLTDGVPVSFEVFSDDLDEMEKQARIISAWGESVFVKIPITNSYGISTAEVLRRLTIDGIKVNVTAVMTLEQTQTALASLRDPGNIVSIFAGRVADTGVDPEPMISEAKRMASGRQLILWASAREVFNVCQASRSGADIITLSPELLAKMKGFGRDLTAYSLETVQQFKKDAEGITL